MKTKTKAIRKWLINHTLEIILVSFLVGLVAAANLL